MNAVSNSPILCPTDFSPAATHALRWGGQLAERLGHPLVALYADRFLPPPHFTTGQIDAILQELDRSRAAADESLRDQVRVYVPATVSSETLVERDLAVPAIVRVAADRSASLIVMGSHGHSGFDRIMLGSVTERVLRLTDRPVLTVKAAPGADPAALPHIRTILCPVDMSEASRPALGWAARLASAFDATLRVMHVLESGDIPAGGPSPKEALCAWVPEATRTSCRLEETIRSGNAADEIIADARESGCDLVVLGTRHRTFYDATVLGSTVARITRHAPCPVLTVPVS